MSIMGHAVPVLIVAFPILVIIGMFSDVQGHSSPSVWFGWHPVLMSIAFPCLMVLGRWSYVAGPEWGIEAKQSQRVLHAIFMGSAMIVMLAGYSCIIVAHYPNSQFFGFNFNTLEWSQWKRVIHVYTGYAAILCALQQAAVGALKFTTLQTTGIRSYTFHGQLGKLNIFLAGFSIAMAIWFWGWNRGMKKLMLVVLGVIMAAVKLTPTPPPKPEDTTLIQSDHNDAQQETREVL